jgi:hypothetical protein
MAVVDVDWSPTQGSDDRVERRLFQPSFGIGAMYAKHRLKSSDVPLVTRSHRKIAMLPT